MFTSRSRKGFSSRRCQHTVAKPRGILHPRVQQVGPDHFAILCFDCGKRNSKLLLADFYGRGLRGCPVSSNEPCAPSPEKPSSCVQLW